MKDETGFAKEVDAVDSFYVTQAYLARMFEGDVFTLQGVEDVPVDNNGNQLYDLLTFDIAIDFLLPGEYELSGRLIDASGQEVEWSRNTIVVQSSGLSTVSLEFSGSNIGRRQSNGPFTLTDLNIFSIDGQSLSVVLTDVFTSGSYQFTQFEEGFYRTSLPIVRQGFGQQAECVPTLEETQTI